MIDKFGNKIIDFKKNNLHIVGYSIPVNKKLKKNELFKHLHTIPDQPKAIPYITSYYKRYWGFCVSDEKKKLFQKKYSKKDKFKVVIKSNLNKFGFLNYGELLIKGKSRRNFDINIYMSSING